MVAWQPGGIGLAGEQIDIGDDQLTGGPLNRAVDRRSGQCCEALQRPGIRPGAPASG